MDLNTILEQPLLIVEEGQANQGDVNVAEKICKEAKATGCNGVEFQFFLADDMYVPGHWAHKHYKNNELSRSEICGLIRLCHDLGLLVQIAGLSVEMIELCATNGVDMFCVNATDLTNPFILDAVGSSGIPFWLATLMGTMEEIEWAVDYLEKEFPSADFGLLHGQHVMTSTCGGVPSSLLQLDCIQMLKDYFGKPVGFVDHTKTKFVPALAIAKGADMVTKHMAPVDNWKGPDYQICLSPDDFYEVVDMFTYAFAARGSSKQLHMNEIQDRSKHRRSLYVNKNLNLGDYVTAEDLVALRPGDGGIDPRFLSQILGRKLSRDIAPYEQIKKSDFF